MIWTRRCDLLGIDVPVVQPRFGPWPSLEVPAAVSNAGAVVGSLGTRPRTFDEILRRLVAGAGEALRSQPAPPHRQPQPQPPAWAPSSSAAG